MSDQRIVSGYVRRAHGIRGEVIVRSLSDDPDRFAVGARLLTDESPPRELIVSRSRSHADGHLLLFESITDRTTAEGLVGVSLTIDPNDRRPLEDDEYWPDQLAGLDVVDEHGHTVGTVSDVVLGEAQDRLVVRTPDGRDVEVPFVDALVGEIDLDAKTVVISPPEGLFPDD